ncbi:MAG: O-methyltransferase [Propionibacteriaceae bacterium]|nr:O-methyltransferase [Propionibacteriaceae bacterium]
MSSLSPQALDLAAQFAESYIADSPEALLARQASRDLGIEPISAGTARFLTLLTRLINAQAVAEIGTGAAVSALAFFSGMSDDAVVTSVDREAEHQAAAREALKAAKISHTRYRLITGEALIVLPKLRAQAYDIVFIDADPMEYPEYFEEALRIVRPGGLVIVNHVLAQGKVADPTNFDDDTMIIRDTIEAARSMDDLTCAVVPVGDGLLVCVTAS